MRVRKCLLSIDPACAAFAGVAHTTASPRKPRSLGVLKCIVSKGGRVWHMEKTAFLFPSHAE